MKLFRAKWLRWTFPYLLLLVLLSPDPFSAAACRGDGDDKDDFSIRTPQYADIFSASLRQLEIKYRIDSAVASIIPGFLGIVSHYDEERISVEPFSSVQLTNRDRGPPIVNSLL